MSDSRLQASSASTVLSPRFAHTLATDAELRDAFVEYLSALSASENALDRVDEKHSLDFQRGKVAAYRGVIEYVRGLEHHQGEQNGVVR